MKNLLAFLLISLPLYSAGAVVQSKQCSLAISNGNSGTCTFDAPPSTANQIALALAVATIPTGTWITDAGGNIYTLEVNQLDGARAAQIWRSRMPGATSGAISFLNNAGGPNLFLGVFMFEVSGLSAAPPDTTSGANGASSPFPCGTTTTTVANDFLLAAFEFNAGVATITPPTGFATTAPGFLSEGTGAVGQPGAGSTFPLTGTVSTAYTWTTSGNAAAACAIAAFKPFGSPTTTIVPRKGTGMIM